MREIILGLDPGTVTTGFAVLVLENEQIILQDLGVLSCNKKTPLEKRLSIIGKKIESLYKKYQPQETAIEQVFLGKSIDSAFKLGHIFGLCSYQASCFDSHFFSYASRRVKQSVTGSGNADKLAVKSFVLNIFGLSDIDMTTDATDALAIALCHIYQKQQASLQETIYTNETA